MDKTILFLSLVMSTATFAAKESINLNSEKKTVIIKKLVTKSDKVYHNVEVDACNHHGLAILHDSGCTTIPLKDLPDDLKKKYAGNVAKLIEKYKKEKAEKRAKIKIERAERLANTDLYEYTVYIKPPKKKCRKCARGGGGRSQKKYQLRTQNEKKHHSYSRFNQTYVSCDCFGGYIISRGKRITKKIRTTPEKFSKILINPSVTDKYHLRILEIVDNGYIARIEKKECDGYLVLVEIPELTINGYVISIEKKLKVCYRETYDNYRGIKFHLSGMKSKLMNNETWSGQIWAIGAYSYKFRKLRMHEYTADPEIAANFFKTAD